MGTLYTVATPIGNLDDISLRALRVLGAVGSVIAEDTRHTRRLLVRHGVRARLHSFHAHSSPARCTVLIGLLDSGDAALVTDAGTPGVSDPGAELVRAAIAAGHLVVPIPGPSAVAAALSVAGMPADRYLFLGFLPRQAAARRAVLGEVVGAPLTVVCFEAPHRLLAALADLLAVLGDRRIVVCRELTKMHEEIWRGRLSEAVAQWSDRPPRGEFTLVLEGRTERRAAWDEAQVRSALADRRAAGVQRRLAAREIALAAGWPARDVYRLWPEP